MSWLGMGVPMIPKTTCRLSANPKSRAALPQQGVNLARFDDEIDRFVGGETAETFGDPMQFESHCRPPCGPGG